MSYFDKLGSYVKSSDETILDPRDLFYALSEKGPGLDYLRGPQDQVLTEWHKRRSEKDLIIKMNTGSGKTLVALLIARSLLNEGIGPVAYLVPDAFLRTQVLEEASRLGIEVADSPDDYDFQRGRSVLISTFKKLFNGRSVFGVNSKSPKSPKYDLAGLVVDDAHACLSQADEVFRLTINSDLEAYGKLFKLFEEDLKDQSSNVVLDLHNGKPEAIQEVPFWAWQKKEDEVRSILHPISEQDSIAWSWPLVADYLKQCTAVFTSEAIDIFPFCLPIDTLEGFSKAKRRVYLSATLVDDSALVRGFDVAPESVVSPICPSNAGDIGDRMILMPQRDIPGIGDDDIRRFIAGLAETQNVVVLTPSYSRADSWEEFGAKVLDKDSIQDGITELRKNSTAGLVVLVNRYDGIDLPGDACRILVIDGLPEALSGPERLMQTQLFGSDAGLSRQMQRLEQGMGRATRSNEDYAVVLLFGEGAIRRANHIKVEDFVSRATRAQLEISDSLREKGYTSSLEILGTTIKTFLDRDKSWISNMKGALAELRYPDVHSPDASTLERQAFRAAACGNYSRAVKFQSELVNLAGSEDLVKALRLQRLAAYTNANDSAKAQGIQRSAYKLNRQLLKPYLAESTRPDSMTRKQARIASSWLEETYSSANKLRLGMQALAEDLKWDTKASKFEEAFNNLAKHIGHNSRRPDAQESRGPDHLWSLCDGGYFVVEAKNQAEDSHHVYKSAAEQLSNSMDWFRQLYPGEIATPVLIHPRETFDHHAAIPQDCHVITTKKLTELRKAVQEYADCLVADNTFRDPEKVAVLLNQFSFTGTLFLKKYSVPGRMAIPDSKIR